VNGREYLTFLQKLSDPADGFNDSAAWARTRVRQMGLTGSKAREYLNAWANPPGMPQLSAYFERHVYAPFVAALPPEVQRSLADVVVGLVPVRTVNASTLIGPSGDLVVTMNTGLLGIVSFLHELNAEVINQSDPLTHPDLLVRRYRFIVDYYNAGGALEYPRDLSPLSPLWIHRVYQWSLATELFVVAHELAHVHLGHVNANSTQNVNLARGTNVAALVVSKPDAQQEFDADALAWRWVVEHYQAVELIDDLPPEVFGRAALEHFLLLVLIDRNGRSPEIPDTHPKPMKRLRRLIDQAPEHTHLLRTVGSVPSLWQATAKFGYKAQP
jgi:hypothetical protein